MQLERLQELLESVFDEDELRQFLAYKVGGRASLPGYGAPSRRVFFAAVTALKRRGLVNRELFELLEQTRPARAGDITEVMRTMGLDSRAHRDDNGLPEGWCLSGSRPGYYTAGLITHAPHERFLAFANASAVPELGFGTVMQAFNANDYRNRRVCYKALLRTFAVKEWAGIWMRIDEENCVGVAFDNMRNRALKGTTPWTLCKVVLDASALADRISFGVLLSGDGQVDLRAQTIEETDEDVTGRETRRSPINLW